MKIRLTLEVDDELRRAMRKRDGNNGLATRAEVLQEIHDLWDAHKPKTYKCMVCGCEIGNRGICGECLSPSL